MKNVIFIILFSLTINGYIAAQICVNQQNNVGINHLNPTNIKLSVVNNTERYTIRTQYDDNISGLSHINGLENVININSTTIPFGVNNRFSISANALDKSVYGYYNHITSAHAGQVYGMKNDLISSGTGIRKGIAAYITAQPNSGAVYGIENGIEKYSNEASYGYNIYTNMYAGAGGNAFGISAQILNQSQTAAQLNNINANSNMIAVYGSLDADLEGYAGYFKGRIYADGTSFMGSDISLKREIKDLSNSMSVIKMLQPKQYKLKNCKFDPDRLTYGFIAQDVEKILPELVISVIQPGERQKVILKKEETITNTDGTKTIIPEEVEMVQNMDGKPLLAINYDGILPIVVDGLQEQDEKICTNSNDIQKLEARIKQLEDDLKTSNENCKALLEQIGKLTQTSGL